MSARTTPSETRLWPWRDEFWQSLQVWAAAVGQGTAA
jgi:hypothetical protein